MLLRNWLWTYPTLFSCILLSSGCGDLSDTRIKHTVTTPQNEENSENLEQAPGSELDTPEDITEIEPAPADPVESEESEDELPDPEPEPEPELEPEPEPEPIDEVEPIEDPIAEAPVEPEEEPEPLPLTALGWDGTSSQGTITIRLVYVD